MDTVDRLGAIRPRHAIGRIKSQIEAGNTYQINFTFRLRAQVTDIFRAMFPSGSVTGAPKHGSMSILRDLEPDPRGVYTGAIGYAAPDGRAHFNVAIRTVVIDRRRAQRSSAWGAAWSGTRSPPRNMSGGLARHWMRRFKRRPGTSRK